MMKKPTNKKKVLFTKGEGQTHLFVNRTSEDAIPRYFTINESKVEIKEKKCTKKSGKNENLISSMVEKTKTDEHNV